MRLVKLKKVPIRVECKFGAVIIEQEGSFMCISTKPDTGYQSRIWIKGIVEHIDQEGHRVLMEKRHDAG